MNPRTDLLPTQADIDAWEKYGPRIFHCEMTGPEALAAHRLAHTPDAAGFIVANSSGDRWRAWDSSGPVWVEDRSEATIYHRRKDAEAVHEEDEDAWRIEAHTPETQIGRDGLEELTEDAKDNRYSSELIGIRFRAIVGSRALAAIPADPLRARLVEALKPFAKAANLAHNNHITANVYVADLRRARAILAELTPESG